MLVVTIWASYLAMLISAARVEKIGEASNLRELVRIIGSQRNPTVEEVLAAHRDYVNLHQIQSSLAGSVGNKQSSVAKDEQTAETEYERITSLLRQPLVDLIAKNLFEAIEEPTSSENIEINPKLRSRIERAIEDLQM